MKKLTAPEKRRLVRDFMSGLSVSRLSALYSIREILFVSDVEAVIRSEAIKRARAKK